MEKLKAGDVVRTNKGYMKVNGIELSDLKECEVTAEPQTKSLPLMNSATEAEVITSVKCKLTFKLHKRYSRFKPAILEALKNLQNFYFDFEGTNVTPDGKEEESIYISDCYINGNISLLKLAAENDFGEDVFEAGFDIANAEYTNLTYGQLFSINFS